MVLKRSLGDGGSEFPSREPKRRNVFSSLPWNLFRGPQELAEKFEPIFRKLVREEVETAISSAFMRACCDQNDSSGSSAWQLRFDNNIPDILFTSSKVESLSNRPVKITLYDANSNQIVSSGPLSCLKITTPSPASFQRLTRLIITNRINKTRPEIRPIPKPTNPSGSRRKIMEMGNSTSSSTVERRFPLSAVVEDCVKRWFEDTLKEAEAGDVSMQVLVGQMYCSGYGVPKNAHKGKAWIERASRSRSSALKVGAKRPGYNVSDSDSGDGKDEGK